MSVSGNFSNIIKSYDASIQEKKEENAELAQQETTQREAANEQGWKAFYAKLALRAQKSKIESFLKESGGIFNLNDEQRAFYSQLLAKSSSLTGDYKSARNLQYSYNMSATALSNRQMSNYSTIFDDTLDRGEYISQQALFDRMSEGLV